MKIFDYYRPVILCILPLLFSYCGGVTQSKEDVNSQPNTLQTVDIKEWPVPWEGTRPRDPFVGIDGKVWFVGQQGNYVAFLKPDTEEFKRFELKKGTYPHNLVVDKDGFVWYAGNRDSTSVNWTRMMDQSHDMICLMRKPAIRIHWFLTNREISGLPCREGISLDILIQLLVISD